MIVSKCPSCHEAVTVPDASRSARVRCPLCQDEYTVREVLERCPPLLELLDASPTEATSVLDDALDAVGPVSAVDDSPAPAFEFNESPALAAPMPAQRTAASPQPAARRPRRKARNPLIEIVKVVGGGAAGLFIAQMLLWWMPFDLEVGQRDPASVGRNLGKYIPWIVPAQVRGAAQASDTDGAAKSGGDGSVWDRAAQEQRDRQGSRRGRPQSNQNSQAAPPRGGQSNSGGQNTSRGRDTGSQDSGGGLGDGGGQLAGGGDDENGLTDPLAPPEVPSPAVDVPGSIDIPKPPISPPVEKPTSGFKTTNRRSPEDLAAAIAAARQSNDDYDAAPSGEGLALANRMYASLAEIGNVLRGVDMKQKTELAPHLSTLGELLASLGPHKHAGISKLAETWLKNRERANDGIALTGVLKSIEPLEGDYYLCHVELGDTGATVPVLGWIAPQAGVRPGAKVLVLGVILEDPSDSLIGYPGSAEETVCGLFLRILAPAPKHEGVKPAPPVDEPSVKPAGEPKAE